MIDNLQIQQPDLNALPPDMLDVQLDTPPEPNVDGSVDVDLDPDIPEEQDQPQPDFHANLAEYMAEEDLNLLGMDLKQLFDEDKLSRQEWEKTFTDGLEYLGMNYKERSEPWPGACGVYDPLIAEALTRFQSNAIMEIFPSEDGPAKSKVIGDQTPDRLDQGDRVADFMNFTLTQKMKGYRLETEKLLYGLGLQGSAFRKVYRDDVRDRPECRLVSAENFIMPYGAADLESCPRYTEVIAISRNDLKRSQKSGFYRDIELDEPMVVQDEVQDKKDKVIQQSEHTTHRDYHHLLEIHTDYDLKGFEDPGGIALPYCITIERDTYKVLSIYRNYEEQDPKRLKKQHYAAYHFLPAMGAYGYGLIHLVGSIARGSTMLLRQLIDAGTLANLPAGFKTDVRIKSGDESPLKPGEWRVVNLASGKLAEAFFPIPSKEPSATLLQLREGLVETGRRLASLTDIEVGDMSAQAPVGTTLAILERNMKVMSAIQARIHSSLADEFAILKRVINESMDEEAEYPYDVHGQPKSIKKADFAGVEVIPVSNPNSATMAERILQFQGIWQMMVQKPEVFDASEVARQGVRVLGIKNAEILVPDKNNIQLMDPVSENQAIVCGQPVKTFETQDHPAHITTHQAFVQDPKTAAILGQNPNAAAIMAGFQAHIAEHYGQQYRQEIAQKLGVPLPGIGQPLPADVESALSLAVAEAAQKLLDQDKAEAAQQQAEQVAQDPVFQLQQKELEIKQAAVQQKQQSDQARVEADLKKAADREQTERMRIESTHQTNSTSVQVNAEKDAEKLRLENERLRMEQEKLKAEIAVMLAKVHQLMAPDPPAARPNG